LQIATQQTCPADLDSKCGDAASGDWEGEFFPGIPKIKYEVREAMKAYSFD
jgi:xylose isomerase